MKEDIESLCDNAMYEIISELKPQHIIGIGRYATRLCQRIVDKNRCNVQGVHYLRHPSPRSVQNVEQWQDTFVFLLQQHGLFNLNRF